MVDRDDEAETGKGDGPLDVLGYGWPLDGPGEHPDGTGAADADGPVDWAGHVPGRRPGGAGARRTGARRTARAPGRAPDEGAPPDDEADGCDPVGWVPAPRDPQTGEPSTPLARLALARTRKRLAVVLDVVSFTAACPACGGDAEWVQERQDTKVRSTVRCPRCGL